ncbi:hypothetical protein N7456_000155 [Penicillium angulare]|uniref:Uncharacterized protein n=1 Tax=Penicillium angulare TaxID=116970 RepID=A0A9W9GBZ7_9EURO|nr:hypothetical protein N7456_000155 [Penicillium angulare]
MSEFEDTPEDIKRKQAIVDDAKNKWVEQTKVAISAKPHALEDYEREKEFMLEISSFNDWAPLGAPQFYDSYLGYISYRDAFFAPFAWQDHTKYEDFKKKYDWLNYYWKEGDLGDGKKKGSNFILISCDDVERYDETMKAKAAKS